MWESLARVVAVIAGNQSGKTEASALWLLREIKRCGPGDYGFISPTFTLMEMKALPCFRRVFEHIWSLGTFSGSPVRKFTFSEQGERTLWGGKQQEPTVVYFGYADNPDSLESATYKACVCDEAGQKAFKQGSYEALRRRLAVKRGRMLIATTPYTAFGWLKSEIVDQDGKGEVEVVRFTSLMNPAYPREEYERARRALPLWKFELFYEAKLTKPAGVIYDCLDNDNILKDRPLPDTWPRIMGIDFGPVNTAAVFLAKELDPWGTETGKFIVYRTYHPRLKRSPIEHKLNMLRGERGVPQVVGGSHSEDEWRGDFGRAGLLIMEPPVKEVEVGIDRTYALIKEKKLLFFRDGAAELIEELQTYSRELDDSGNVTEKIENKSEFHLTDALRYVCSQLRQQGVSTVDWSGPFGKKKAGKYQQEEDEDDRPRPYGGRFDALGPSPFPDKKPWE
jgi:hypothetical protein